jgi:hypothetical protein
MLNSVGEPKTHQKRMLNIFSVITGEIEVALSIVARKINVS